MPLSRNKYLVLNLSLELRVRHIVRESSSEQLLIALDKLSIQWKSKDHISKLAAGAMLNAQEMFTDLHIFSGNLEQKRVQEASQQVLVRIDTCLH